MKFRALDLADGVLGNGSRRSTEAKGTELDQFFLRD
jgi:hypothetical protein